MPFSKPKFEAVPKEEKYPVGKDMRRGKKLKCMACKDGQTIKGPCVGCEGTGYIKI